MKLFSCCIYINITDRDNRNSASAAHNKMLMKQKRTNTVLLVLYTPYADKHKMRESLLVCTYYAKIMQKIAENVRVVHTYTHKGYSESARAAYISCTKRAETLQRLCPELYTEQS